MAEMTEQEKQTDPQELAYNRRSLMEVLEFLSRRGVSVDVIQLAMVRAGISTEVARILAQCVVATPTPSPPVAAIIEMPPQLSSTPIPLDRSSRAAEIALRKLIGFTVAVAVIWGVGITLGFAVGMEIGLSQGIEAGLDRVGQLIGLN